MIYLELIEIEFTEEQLVKCGRYLGDVDLWVGKEPGVYLANDGIANFIVVFDGTFAGTSLIPLRFISNTKPKLDEDIIHNHLLSIGHQLGQLLGRPSIPTQASGIDGDTPIRALAVAQKPELAKEL